MVGRKRPEVVALGAAAVTLVLTFAALAYACTPVARLSVDQQNVSPGDEVRGAGTGFGPGNAPGVTPVELHLGSASGQLLWSGTSSEDGRFSFSFTAPAVAPDYYAITAVRPGAQGDPTRAVVRIGNPETAKPVTPTPAPGRPAAPQVGATAPTPVVGQAPSRSTSGASPGRQSAPARRQARAGAPRAGAHSPKRAASGNAKVFSGFAPKTAGSLIPSPGTGERSSGAPARAGSFAPRSGDRLAKAERRTSLRAPDGAQPGARAGSSTGGSSGVWFGLGLVAIGLLAALAAAASLGGFESRRWSFARRRRKP